MDDQNLCATKCVQQSTARQSGTHLWRLHALFRFQSLTMLAPFAPVRPKSNVAEINESDRLLVEPAFNQLWRGVVIDTVLVY